MRDFWENFGGVFLVGVVIAGVVYAFSSIDDLPVDSENEPEEPEEAEEAEEAEEEEEEEESEL